MLGIPEWAIGFGALLVLVSVLKVVTARLLPTDYRSRRLKDEPPQGLDEVQARLAELDDVKHRLVELEERVDFTERLLAQQREADRLGPPPR